MGWILGWTGVLAVCALAAGLILRGPVRHLTEDVHAERARELFRKRREWLEADFLDALGKTSPTERLRWEDAHWHAEILWARDRQTRRLLAHNRIDQYLYDRARREVDARNRRREHLTH